MRVLNIVETIVDGPHLRTSVYFAGCTHHCKGCHNPQSWDFNQGEELTPYSIFDRIENFDNKYVTLSGGDPLEQSKDQLIELLENLKEHNYNIWVYTGYLYENINPDILCYIDVLVDSPFILELRDTDLLFKGSSNQRIIDVQKSLNNNKIILWKNL